MRYKFAIFLCLLVVLLFGSIFFSTRFLLAAKAQGTQAMVSVGTLPAQLKTSQLLGHDQTNRQLHMSVGLALRNQGQLDTFLKNLYDPASSQFHQFLTVEQFTQQFSPTVQQHQAVIDYLTQQGFAITTTYPNRTLIDFDGSQAQAEHVFQTTINSYRSSRGQTFFANARPPLLPASIAPLISYVGGLDNSVTFHHPPIASKQPPTLAPARAGAGCPVEGHTESGPGLFGGFLASGQVAYIPSQFSKAYNYDGLHKAGFNGQGQTIGLFELDGYDLNDINMYSSCFGGANVALKNVLLDGFNGQAGQGGVEVELDIELLLSMAPKLAKIIVYEAPNTLQGYNDEFARIVTDRTPVVSVSWGDCETNMSLQELQQENGYFREAAAQGQSILVASGDSGSETCWQQSFNPSLIADDPAAEPFVTAVGGTTLALNADNTYLSEHVWNSGMFGGAGGGGLSMNWHQPEWQTGPGTQGRYANGMRQTPDVSLDADPATGYPIYCTVSSCSSGFGSGGGWLTVGGTSAAAPMWAAMIALANQKAAKMGKGPLGFLNPAIYKIASGNHYARDFHDTTPPTASGIPSNNDELGFNGGAYPVTNGYDMATGWGSFNATALANDLCLMDK